MVERYKATEIAVIDAIPEGEKTRQGGQKSLYKPEYDEVAKKLCSFGATDGELADAFGVHTNTIRNWYSAHPSFGEAVRYGKAAVFDPKVERTMAQLALGYEVDVEEVKVTKDGDVIRYTIRKHFAPNVTAGIFWLKNRQPDKWRDVQSHEHKFDMNKATAADMLKEIQKEAAELGITNFVSEKPQGVAPVAKPNGTKH